MNPYYEADGITIYHGDSFDILHDLSGIDAVVTDPPYSSGGAFRGDHVRPLVHWRPHTSVPRSCLRRTGHVTGCQQEAPDDCSR